MPSEAVIDGRFRWAGGRLIFRTVGGTSRAARAIEGYAALLGVKVSHREDDLTYWTVRTATLKEHLAADKLCAFADGIAAVLSDAAWLREEAKRYGPPADLRAVLRDVVREEMVTVGQAGADFAKNLRWDIYPDWSSAHYRVTHLPTGVQADAPTRDKALRDLWERLVQRGAPTVDDINDMRAALGLRPFKMEGL